MTRQGDMHDDPFADMVLDEWDTVPDIKPPAAPVQPAGPRKSYNFRLLKQYAQRKYKINQDKSLTLLAPPRRPPPRAPGMTDVEFEKSQTDFEQARTSFADLRNGVCAALTMAWLATHNKLGAHFVDENIGVRDDLTKTQSAHVHNAELIGRVGIGDLFREYKSAAEQWLRIKPPNSTGFDIVQREFDKNQYGSLKLMHLVGLAARDIIGPITKADAPFPEQMVSYIQNTISKYGIGGIYVSLSMQKTGRPTPSKHGVGVYYDGSTVTFFDPNTGLYEIDPGKNLDFFTCYQDCYRRMGYDSLGIFALMHVQDK